MEGDSLRVCTSGRIRKDTGTRPWCDGAFGSNFQTHLVEGHGEGAGDGETLPVLELALDGGEVADGEVLGLPRLVLPAGISAARGVAGGGGRRLREAATRTRGQQQEEEEAEAAPPLPLASVLAGVAVLRFLATGRPAAARPWRAGAHGRRRHRSAPPSSPHLKQGIIVLTFPFCLCVCVFFFFFLFFRGLIGLAGNKF
jgi:hypothetical protein